MNIIKSLFDNNRMVYFFLLILTGAYLAFVEYLFPNSFLISDNATYYLPSYVYNIKSLFNDQTFPLINFYQYLGTTHLAQGQTGVLYPPIYIAGLLSKLVFKDYLHTMIILAFMHYYASSVGMFLLLKRFRVGSLLAFISTVMWITFPFFIFVGRGWIFILYTIAYLPFNFLLLDKLLKSYRVKYAVFLSILKALFFFQGYVQYVFMLVFIEFLYFLIHIRIEFDKFIDLKSIKNLWKKFFKNKNFLSLLKLYTTSLILFVALISPLLFPMLEAQRESYYRSLRVPIGDFLEQYLTLLQFIRTQFFKFDIIGAFWVSNEIFYVGLINIFFIILALFYSFSGKLKSIKNIYVLQILAVVTLLLSTRFYIIFYPIPVFNYFRWPFKYFLFFLFFTLITVAVFLNSYLIKRSRKSAVFVYILLTINISLNIYTFYQDSDSVLDKFSIKNESSYLDEYINTKKGRILSYIFPTSKYDDFSNFYTHNFATMYEKHHFAGYDPLRSELINNLALGLDISIPKHKFVFDKHRIDYLNNWSVRYIILNSNNYDENYKHFFNKHNILFGNDRILLLENDKAVPYVFYFQGNNEDLNKANFIGKTNTEYLDYRFGINEINVYPEVQTEKNLVFNVAPLKWYKLYINGIDQGFIQDLKSRPHISVNENTRIVTLKYINYYYYSGWLVFLISLIAILYLYFKDRSSIN